VGKERRRRRRQQKKKKQEVRTDLAAVGLGT